MRWRWPPESLTPALADGGREALRHRLDEVEAPRRRRRGDHLVLAGFGPAIADILHDGAVEQRGILRHDAHALAQAFLGDLRRYRWPSIRIWPLSTS